MNTARHTPGPWKPANVLFGHNGVMLIYAADGYAIANAGGIPKRLPLEAAANARLIAAAPDLLAACQGLVEAIMSEQGGADLLPVEPEWDPEHFRLIESARAAIARATH